MNIEDELSRIEQRARLNATAAWVGIRLVGEAQARVAEILAQAAALRGESPEAIEDLQNMALAERALDFKAQLAASLMANAKSS